MRIMHAFIGLIIGLIAAGAHADPVVDASKLTEILPLYADKKGDIYVLEAEDLGGDPASIAYRPGGSLTITVTEHDRKFVLPETPDEEDSGAVSVYERKAQDIHARQRWACRQQRADRHLSGSGAGNPAGDR